jgi:hypothetical protein
MALRDLAIKHAPEQIAQVGDIVTAEWGGWKVPHKVKITKVAVEIGSIDLTIRQRFEMGLTGWLIVQYQYCGRRINKQGIEFGYPYGFLLTNFTTADGKQHKRIPSGFNHVGLVFNLDERNEKGQA